jgi:hypothetical protein
VTRPHFDPYALLRELESERVTYVIVGAFARVIQGSDELTDGVDLTPSPRQRNLDRLQAALKRLNAQRVDGEQVDLTEDTLRRNPTLELRSDAGEIKIVLEPEGTRGYDDLRHRADRVPVGEGLRPAVADPGDLVRMLEALGRDQDRFAIETMQRAIEIDRGLGWER